MKLALRKTFQFEVAHQSLPMSQWLLIGWGGWIALDGQGIMRTPTVFQPPAQGYGAAVTLGKAAENSSTLKGLYRNIRY